MNAGRPKTERQIDQQWVEETREEYLRRTSPSRARTFAPLDRCRFTRIERVRQPAERLALCVFALVVTLVVIQATGAAPFVKAWVMGWLA